MQHAGLPTHAPDDPSTGIDNGTRTTATSPAANNNGAGQLVTATFSPTTGMRFYVDGALAGSPSTTSAEPDTGYWRVR